MAFQVPTITTDLSGFGEWVSESPQGIETGVGIVHRSDYNAYEVATQIAQMIRQFALCKTSEIKAIRKNAALIAEKALWKHFIKHYEQAYEVALGRREGR
ncbi:hypothetical protein SDC9_126672 [bioreactor metagenome]|uniref:Glycogen synthase n=1 Tax=bioreactor metagenome TaxID=1076179 RepID=A0A645CRV1_9ZZZZ